jgi:hypothetical protein
MAVKLREEMEWKLRGNSVFNPKAISLDSGSKLGDELEEITTRLHQVVLRSMPAYGSKMSGPSHNSCPGALLIAGSKTTPSICRHACPCPL